MSKRKPYGPHVSAALRHALDAMYRAKTRQGKMVASAIVRELCASEKARKAFIAQVRADMALYRMRKSTILKRAARQDADTQRRATLEAARDARETSQGDAPSHTK